MSKEILVKSKTRKSFFYYGKKFFGKNFIILLLILIVYNIVRYAAHYGALFIGKSLELPLFPAQIIFYLIYFGGLAGIVLFLTFASFYAVILDKKLIPSIKSSRVYVSQNYLLVLSLILIFFVIDQLLSFFDKTLSVVTISELIDYVFILPYLFLVLSKLILSSNNDISTS